jgi:glycosyltransferase involved in cell wall biosynthesis
MIEVGIVVIGRNEGGRLRRCLASVTGQGHAVVYVDSGSTDGSIELARSMGASVIALDPSTPFTAARARNAGAEHLLSEHPEASYIQCVDGDCELVNGWLDRARREPDVHPDWAVTCGRLRERYPNRSVYNRLDRLFHISTTAGTPSGRQVTKRIHCGWDDDYLTKYMQQARL